jgi:methylenetetrahydrofolate reductase (NADPH)
MPTDHASPLARRLASASVEISPRAVQINELRENFDPGLDVTITFLPGYDYRNNIATATTLHRAGFKPAPHVAAREFASREALDDFLARIRGEAGVQRILVIAGDVARARGPFKSSLDVCSSGLIEAHGFEAVSFAAHPEGHPHLDTASAFGTLAAKRDWGLAAGIRVDFVLQFGFESGPVLDWMNYASRLGLGAPIVVGLAGPATPTTLLKFALRCGIGNSLRSLRGQIGRFGRLLTDLGPDAVVRGLFAASPASTAALAGFHFFPFGGLRKTREWLDGFELEEPGPRAAARAAPLA